MVGLRTSPLRPLGVLLLILGLAGQGSGSAAEVEICPDVPTDAGAIRILASQTVTGQGGGNPYTPVHDGSPLGEAANINGLFRISPDDLLMTFDTPIEFGGSRFGSADVVLYTTSGGYSLYLAATTLGVTAESANINGIAVDQNNDLLMTFDTPIEFGGSRFQAVDILKWNGSSLSLFLDASALPVPIPDDANLNGFEVDDSGTVYMTFDTPIEFGGSRYRAGEIVAYELATGSASVYWSDLASFDVGAVISDFTFPPPAGRIDGVMTLAKDDPSGTSLTAAWTPSCSSSASAYAVYEGDLTTLATAYSHDTQLMVAPASPATFTSTGAITYYLVVPRTGDFEGGYGEDSSGAERPASGAADLPQMSRDCP